MGNRITNGGFVAGLSFWSLNNAEHQTDGDETAGCAELQAEIGEKASIRQDIKAPGCQGSRNVTVRFRFSMKPLSGHSLELYIFSNGKELEEPPPDEFPMSETEDDWGDEIWLETPWDWPLYLEKTYTPTRQDEWLAVEEVFNVPQDTTLAILFVAPRSVPTSNYWRIDDVFLDTIEADLGTCRDLEMELRRLRNDTGAVKHPQAAYRRAVNQAIREAPMSLWEQVRDETVTTTTARLYSLASVLGLREVGQVTGVWMEDANGDYARLVHYELEDRGESLMLYLWTEPPEEDRKIRVDYLRPWPVLDCSNTATDTIGLDREWLLARAMTILLMQARPDEEPPEWLGQQLAVWDAKRAGQEMSTSHRRPPGRIRRPNPRRVGG